MIEVQGIRKTYKKDIVLNNISFKVNNGEIVGLLGPNGVGKSTLLNIIGGVLLPDAGKVLIDSYSTIIEKKIRLGYSTEENYFYENLTGYEFLYFISSVKFGNKTNFIELLKLFNLWNAKDKLIKNYSMGMKKRLNLCVAFLNNPKNIILDEPTNALDPQGVYYLKEFLKESKKNNFAILIASHIIDFIEKISDRVIILKLNNEYKFINDLSSVNLEKEFIKII